MTQLTQLYVVINSNAPAMSFDIAVRSAFPGKHYRYNDTVWLVVGDEQSAPHLISGEIGIGVKEGIDAVVISVATFYGAAKQDLMEWLQSKGFADRQPNPPMKVDELKALPH